MNQLTLKTFLLYITVGLVLVAITDHRANAGALNRSVTTTLVYPGLPPDTIEIVVPDGADVAWCYVHVNDSTYGPITSIWCKMFDTQKAWWERIYLNTPKENRV